ncbi:uncharacterized protein LOC103579263 [Microplitis demolitor]|uniref:uncharacterized protein LOC103579263 n=1 Tax=Microplitis demolitor TaxID=69319 RepID=UPI00235B5E17|nr:uncharacterized protein LOC103579263 [Microplitis demolitor]
MQEQLDMLAKSVQELIKQQNASQNALINSNQPDKDSSCNKKNILANKAQEVIPAEEAEEEKSPDGVNVKTQDQARKVTESMEEGELGDEDYDLDDELREVLGEEIPVTETPVKINDNLKKWWQEWMSKGLIEEVRESLLKKQPKNENLSSEAPKVNLKVQRHLFDIAKKRDDHFAETQGCKLNEKVKDVKAIVKGASTSKTAEKPAAKKQTLRNLSQGNFRGPPARSRQAETHSRIVENSPEGDHGKECEVILVSKKEPQEVNTLAGRLSFFTEQWESISDDKFIIDWIRGYDIPFKTRPIQLIDPREPTWSSSDALRVQGAVDKLLQKKAIEVCTDADDQFVSTYFLIPKPDGSDRFIINLKKLNDYIETEHFKMEDLRSARHLIDRGAFMANLDLEDAYFLVRVNNVSRKYLRFRLKGQLYQFTCLPFDLCSSPFSFTKIMKPVVNMLRSRGLLSVVYLDDFLCIGNSYKSCKSNIQTTIKLMESLGFIINCNKSSTTPTRRFKYLGFVLDCEKYQVEITNEKRTQVKKMLDSIDLGSSYRIRIIAQLIGVLIACIPGVGYGRTYSKSLARAKWLALMINNKNFEGFMLLKKDVFEDIRWWKDYIMSANSRIKSHNYKLVVTSNASRTGWGAKSSGVVIQGFWSLEDWKFHINYLQLLAVFFALKCFASKLYDCEILLRIDNTTAIACINKAGGIRYPVLSELARKIWQWCEVRRIWPVATYIPSAWNVDADAASRVRNLDTEWELSPVAFQKILKVLGSPSIDLFASRINKKCVRFCSRYPDPDAESVDAFTVSWGKEYFYAFPPFVLVLPTLRKIINDEAVGIVTGASSTGNETLTCGREIIREAFVIKGIKEESISIMLSSLTESTVKQYERPLIRWLVFAQENNIDAFEAASTEVISFLASWFNEGAKYGTLNSSRAAISLISKNSLSNDPLISRFIRGTYKIRPAHPKYSETWDTDIVLTYIKTMTNLDKLKLKELSEITATLLILMTVHRLQTLALIKTGNIIESTVGLKIKISDLIKTSRPGASVQTIGHWINDLLKKAGVDTDIFTAYKAKHAAVSKAYSKGVNVDTIRRTAAGKK